MAELGSVYSHTTTNSWCSSLGHCGGFVVRPLCWPEQQHALGSLGWHADRREQPWRHFVPPCGAGKNSPQEGRTSQNTAFLTEEKHRTGHLTTTDSKGTRAELKPLVESGSPCGQLHIEGEQSAVRPPEAQPGRQGAPGAGMRAGRATEQKQNKKPGNHVQTRTNCRWSVR